MYIEAPSPIPVVSSHAALGRQAAAAVTARCRSCHDALLAADNHKNHFLAMVAHELRNPLAPIRNMLEIIRRADGRGDLIEPCLDAMERQLGQMTRLIDDLFDMNRVSRGDLELRVEEVELGSVLRNAVDSARASIDAAGKVLTVALPAQPVYVRADSGRLAQVFGNLLNNACKFTPVGGRVAIAARREGSDVIVRIADSGIGMSPELSPRIFELFVQGDRTVEHASNGLGIGLALVKQLVQMHGGSVHAFSDGVGSGSEFVVRLPAQPEGRATTQVALPPFVAAEASARRVLVVDDNRDAADSLALLLTLTGYETRTAYDGLEAVECAAAFDPDAVLLDIGLPKLNGYEAARAIRRRCERNGPMLVALTGRNQDEDREKAVDAGFDAHLVKPVEHAALMKVLAGLAARGCVVPIRT